MTGVDLENDVTIIARSVEIYENPREGEVKPISGQKLNKAAIITLYGMTPKNKGKDLVEYELQLRKMIEKNGGEFVSYDQSRFIWTFKVPGF